MAEKNEKKALCFFEQKDKAWPPKKQRLLASAMAEFAEYSFADASTDRITEASGVSKGLLFHYFGSKKDLYLACLKQALSKLTAEGSEQKIGNATGAEYFYDMLFKIMDEKISLCLSHRTETRLVNLASRDSAIQIAQEKNAILGCYAAKVKSQSAAAMKKAVAALSLEGTAEQRVFEGLLLYINALIGRYLLLYQNEPERFFENAQEIKKELREYLDMMLYGILKK